jgi:hypothetical protein
MLKRVLHLKHWQLFLLIVVPLVLDFSWPIVDVVVDYCSFICFAMWMYAIGVYGQEKIAAAGMASRKTLLFRINLIILPLVIFLCYYAMSYIVKRNESEEFTMRLLYIGVLTCAIFVIIQPLFFVAKTLATLELRREPAFNEYVVHVLAIVFLFVGIWVIQPRIKQLIQEDMASE